MLERADVVVGVLERPVGLEHDVVVWRGQVLVDHPVAIGIDGGCELASVVAVDEHRASRFGAEVDADRVPLGHGMRCGSTTIFRPRRSASAANASCPSESAK